MENQIIQEKSRLRPLFFFLSLGVLVSLITSIVSFLNLVFETLNKKFPDVLNASYSYGYNSYDYANLRSSLATLIIVFPIFVVLIYFWNKITKMQLSNIENIIKKWMIYFIIFLSSIVIIVDLVVLVRYFVSGEITNRFIYKVLTTLVTALIVGKYFYISEFWSNEKKMFNKFNIKKLNKIINPAAAVILVAFAIIYSFYTMGSPMKQRLLRLDDRRVQDLQNIQWQVISYWQQKEKLPAVLRDVANPISGYSLPVDPEFEKGKVYEYNIKDEKKLTFELCADFSLPIPQGWQEYKNYYKGGIAPMMGTTDVATSPEAVSNMMYPYPYPSGVNDSWDHQTGRTCFERTIDKDLYPPYPKVLKN
jgi:hypothetical protein